MSKKKRILFIIPDGVGIKNYLYSNVIYYLKNNYDIVFWSTLPKDAFTEVLELHQISIEYKQIKLIPEGLISRLLRESSTYARLIFNSNTVNNKTILLNWQSKKGNYKLKILYKLSEIIGKWASKKYKRILYLEKKGRKYWSKKHIENYKNCLKELDINSILITHQRVAGVMPICIASKLLNIKTITAIFSWDNLPKARLAVKTDIYLVWSKWMKNEMKIYYPEIAQDAVKLVGSPQFEFYLENKYLENRVEFANKYGLNPEKKWICFSGDDELTSPFDPDYLKDIAQSIQSLKENNIELIFRRCPADFSTRFDDVLHQYKDVIHIIDPIWNSNANGWTGFFPKLGDISLQVNLAQHCEGVINVGSTMAHDFITFNKPCLYINYNQKESKKLDIKDIYRFQHFRSMGNLDAVGWIDSKDDIKTKIELLIKTPDLIAKDRKKWMQKIVLHPLQDNSKLIAKELA